MNIADYLEDRLVAFLDVDTRNEAIDVLIEVLDQAGKLPDRAVFRSALLHREQLVSTGIGMSVAVPHAKLTGLSEFFIAIGISKKGIDWNALDKAPVRLVFLIGGPDGRQSEYLQILSQLTSAIRDPELRKELLQPHTKDEVVGLFDPE